MHSGGWKKLQEAAVDPRTFRERVQSTTGVERVINFYGMVEQLGSIFVEGEDRLLHAPDFADVIVRDPVVVTATLPPFEAQLGVRIGF